MKLTELDVLSAGVLPVAEFRDHVRLGTGFADDGAADGVLETYLRAAVSAIEGRTGKALIARRFSLGLDRWIEADRQRLPLAPVQAIESVTLVDAGGTPSAVAPERYRLHADDQRPALEALGSSLPTIPTGGRCDVVFVAGFGTGWDAVPPALAQAVRLLAARFYEHRSEGGVTGDLPFGIAALIEPYRTVRLGGFGS